MTLASDIAVATTATTTTTATTATTNKVSPLNNATAAFAFGANKTVLHP